MKIRIADPGKYVYDLPEGHRFPIRKYNLVRDQLLYEKVIAQDQLYEPGTDPERIFLAHDADYVWRVLDLSLPEYEIRKIGVPIHEKSVARALGSVNGTVMAAMEALNTGIGINIGGGYHHAFSGHGEGFCIFNDLAIAARFLTLVHRLKNILILDLDVHQGNGTASILKEDNPIFTFSMHGAGNYPIQKEKSDWDVELPDGTRDREYLEALDKNLEIVLADFLPGMILYQAGVDILKTDQLGRLEISPEGCRERDRKVLQLAAKKEIPLVITLGGGYSPKIRDITDAHAATIRTALEIFD
jgi:acetoin utilization deacetylase AcuC-like enzyme